MEFGEAYHSQREQDVVRLDKPDDVPSCKESSDNGHHHQYEEGVEGHAYVSAMIRVGDHE